MIKSLVIVGLSLAGLAAASVGVQNALEYAQVVQQRGADGVRGLIPLGIEIERLELLLGKVNREEQRASHDVATAQVALEDALQGLDQDRQELADCKAKLRRLRGLSKVDGGTVQVGCQQVSYGVVRQSMAQEATEYQVKATTMAAREKTAAALEEACTKLACQHTQWSAKREALRVTLASLKARKAALEASSFTDAIDSSQLARATELADQIEQRLRVAERQQQLDGGTPLEWAGSEAPQSTRDVEAEVDSILGEDDDASAGA